jgi:hypothetical protein
MAQRVNNCFEPFSMAASTHVSRADFEGVFPSLVEDVSQVAKQYHIPPNALEWFQKVNHLEKIS